MRNLIYKYGGPFSGMVAPVIQRISGLWRCRTQFNCIMSCPKNVDLTDTIARIKRASLA